MFFRNLIIFKLDKLPENLEEQLARGAFVPCPSNQPMSVGFYAPRDKNGALVENVGGQRLIAMMTETKVLPSDAVNRAVKERCESMEKEQGYAPGRKQRREVHERVVDEMLPNALTKRNTTHAWISDRYLCINAATNTKAEALINHLRHCLDEFPVKPLHTALSPQSAMADWLAGGEAPAGFTIDRDCELKACGEEKSTVAYKHHPLNGDEMSGEVKAHLAGGKLPTKLAMTFNDRISFVLTEKLELKRLAFLDVLKEEAEKNAEHADEQFDADFAIMTGELLRLIPSMIDALGGLVAEE